MEEQHETLSVPEPDTPGGATATLDGAAPEEAVAPTRLCPRCSTQANVAGDFCPHCGASYLRRRRFARLRRHGKAVALVFVVLLLAGGGVGGYLVKHHHDQQVAAQHARAAAAAAQQRREAAHQRALADARAAEDRIKRQMHSELVHSLEASITKDAKKDVDEGLLDGSILRTECQPVGGGNVDDLAAHTGDYSCMAVTSDNADGSSRGYSFTGTVNYDDGSYTWRLGNP